jgi:D-lactate dehydrogenase
MLLTSFSVATAATYHYVRQTVGVIGTGKIGVCLCNILIGFGVNLICYDVHPSDELKTKGAKYVEMDELWSSSHVVFLMTPLFPATHHLFNKKVMCIAMLFTHICKLKCNADTL